MNSQGNFYSSSTSNCPMISYVRHQKHTSPSSFLPILEALDTFSPVSPTD